MNNTLCSQIIARCVCGWGFVSGVYVCVCVCVCVCVSVGVFGCVCMCDREKEREREEEKVCVYWQKDENKDCSAIIWRQCMSWHLLTAV